MNINKQFAIDVHALFASCDIHAINANVRDDKLLNECAIEFMRALNKTHSFCDCDACEFTREIIETRIINICDHYEIDINTIDIT